MAGLSSSIEAFLKELLSNTDDDFIEIGRNGFADQFSCAPPQTDYVLITRFTPCKGYYIEGGRGGSGYVKIIELTIRDSSPIKEIVENAIGDRITKDRSSNIISTLLNRDLVIEREALITVYALEDDTLSKADFSDRDVLRTDLLKNILSVFIR